jgi:hypothetical protein
MACGNPPSPQRTPCDEHGVGPRAVANFRRGSQSAPVGWGVLPRPAFPSDLAAGRCSNTDVPAATRKQTTGCQITCRSPEDRPIIGVAALLQLAEWSQHRRETPQGSEPCLPRKSDSCPPVHSTPDAACGADGNVAGTACEPSASDADHSQSPGRTATRRPTSRKGGGA